jgi:hypothetical protein
MTWSKKRSIHNATIHTPIYKTTKTTATDDTNTTHRVSNVDHQAHISLNLEAGEMSGPPAPWSHQLEHRRDGERATTNYSGTVSSPSQKKCSKEN